MTAMGVALSHHLRQFLGLLKESAIEIDSTRLMDCCRAVLLVGVSRRDDFKCAMRATLIADHKDYPRFEELFDRYWGKGQSLALLLEQEQPQAGESVVDKPQVEEMMERLGLDNPDNNDHGAYSQLNIVRKRDLATLQDQELDLAQRELAWLAKRLARERSRRRVSAPKGREVDFRKMLRRQAGSPINPVIPFRQRARRKSRLFVLCDISGSMERYSRFFLHLLYAMGQSFDRVSVSLFATRTEDITEEFRCGDPEAFRQRLSEAVTAWSGGTKIGSSIEAFLACYGPGLNATTAVTLVISDGWDTGEKETLQEAMVLLRQRSRRIMWLNPLLGDSRYQPLSRGMATALPFVDDFLPAHNIESLSHAVKKIATQL